MITLVARISSRLNVLWHHVAFTAAITTTTSATSIALQQFWNNSVECLIVHSIYCEAICIVYSLWCMQPNKELVFHHRACLGMVASCITISSLSHRLPVCDAILHNVRMDVKWMVVNSMCQRFSCNVVNYQALLLYRCLFVSLQWFLSNCSTTMNTRTQNE